MPYAQKGERRGGRTKGTPNKATADRDRLRQEAMSQLSEHLTPEAIAAMLPLDVMLHTMRISARSGSWALASSIAKEAAPYLHAKVSPVTPDSGDTERKIVVTGGLPDE